MRLSLEKYITLFILILSVIYAWEALVYELLPYEEFVVFKPNTFPIGLSIGSIFLCCVILLIPKKQEAGYLERSKKAFDTSSTSSEDKAEVKKYDIRTMYALIGLMLLYTFFIRRLGFLLSTSLFLFFAAYLLGERKLLKLFFISVISVSVIWYLVEVLLSIYLSPWPMLFHK